MQPFLPVRQVHGSGPYGFLMSDLVAIFFPRCWATLEVFCEEIDLKNVKPGYLRRT